MCRGVSEYLSRVGFTTCTTETGARPVVSGITTKDMIAHLGGVITVTTGLAPILICFCSASRSYSSLHSCRFDAMLPGRSSTVAQRQPIPAESLVANPDERQGRARWLRVKVLQSNSKCHGTEKGRNISSDTEGGCCEKSFSWSNSCDYYGDRCLCWDTTSKRQGGLCSKRQTGLCSKCPLRADFGLL